ncbi:MAG: hypothetical protein QGD94_07985 [Planctomycetia bacterium]|nr:hypothetical protein [Planctomycetia bacterium]
MKRVFVLLLALTLLFGTRAEAIRKPISAGGEDAAALRTKIEKLIRELGDEDYDLREEATKSLMEIGMPALDAIKKATSSSDPEVKYRSARILKALRLGISADWPPGISLICRHFGTMSDRERATGMKKVLAWGGQRTIPFLITVLQDYEQAAPGREAFDALVNFITQSDDSAGTVLTLLGKPQTPQQRRVAYHALRRVGRTLEAIDTLAAVAEGEVPKSEIASAVVDSANRLLEKEDYTELATILKKHKKNFPDTDTRLPYLEAEVLDHTTEKGVKARELRRRALGTDVSDSQRFATADMLENINRPHLASLEWQKVLDTETADLVYRINAYFRLGSIFARIGIPHKGADYLEKGLLALRKAREDGSGMGILGASEEEIEAHIAALRKRAQKAPPTGIEIRLLFKNNRHGEYKKARAEAKLRFTLSVKPYGLRLFEVAKMTVSYDVKTRKLHVLLNGSDASKPVELPEFKEQVTFILSQLDCEYLFSLSPDTGEVKRLAKFEKDYTIYVRPTKKFANATDFHVLINGTRYDADAVQRGIPFDFLPEKMNFVLKATGPRGKDITESLNVSPEQISKHQ